MANGREVVPFYACVSKLTSEKGTFLSHFSLFFCFSTRLFVSLSARILIIKKIHGKRISI